MVAHQRYRLRSLAFTSPGSGTLLGLRCGQVVAVCGHGVDRGGCVVPLS